MPSSTDTVMSLELTPGDGVGEEFLADVVHMLECKAERVGATLEVVQRTDRACVTRLRADQLQLATLGSEVGVHRAQLIPKRSTTGRVVTARVVVTIASGEGHPTSATIVKTYNYPMRKVAVHATGESMDLEDVLAGRE